MNFINFNMLNKISKYENILSSTTRRRRRIRSKKERCYDMQIMRTWICMWGTLKLKKKKKKEEKEE